MSRLCSDLAARLLVGNLFTQLDLGRSPRSTFPPPVVPPLLVAYMSFWLPLTKDPRKGVST